MRRRTGLVLLLLACVGVWGGCVDMPDPTLDENDPGRHARDYTVRPSPQTLSVFDLASPSQRSFDPYP